MAPAERFVGKLPGDLSGGQKQRAVLAQATILDPRLVIADEPVSMLDMSVRAKILEVMLDLKRDLGLTYIYITHDLSTAKYICDRVAIMYLGRIVEIGPTEEVFAASRHPYTQSLLRAVPEPDPARGAPREVIRGEVPDAAARPGGCAFHPRCPRAFEVCGWEGQDLRALLEGRSTGVPGAEMSIQPGQRDTVAVSAGRGRGADAARMLHRIRAAEPDEPFWRGVRAVHAERDRATVEFFPGQDPGLVPADAVEVACHLHDPDVLHRAALLADSRHDPA